MKSVIILISTAMVALTVMACSKSGGDSPVKGDPAQERLLTMLRQDEAALISKIDLMGEVSASWCDAELKRYANYLDLLEAVERQLGTYDPGRVILHPLFNVYGRPTPASAPASIASMRMSMELEVKSRSPRGEQPVCTGVGL